jgi:prevent-host-death family protein
MNEETVNVAKAKKHFSELLGQVAFGKKRILITKRGKPMARLVPADELEMHLCDARGWLENNDPFFDTIDRIILDRSKHVPRMLKEIPPNNVPA